MKIGMRKPNIKKSISARTTGKVKRKIKKEIIPAYGKKGTGWIKNPEKAMYNKVYNEVTFESPLYFKACTLFNDSSNNEKTKNYHSNQFIEECEQDSFDKYLTYLHQCEKRTVTQVKADINEIIIGIFLLFVGMYVFFYFRSYLPLAIMMFSLSFVPASFLLIKSRVRKTEVTLIDVFKQDIEKIGTEWNRLPDEELIKECQFYCDIINLALQLNKITIEQAKDVINCIKIKADELGFAYID